MSQNNFVERKQSWRTYTPDRQKYYDVDVRRDKQMELKEKKKKNRNRFIHVSINI